MITHSCITPGRPTTGIILTPKLAGMKLNHQNWPSIEYMNWIRFGFLPFAYTTHTMLQNIKSRSKFQCRTTNFSLPLPLSFSLSGALTKYLLQPIFFPIFRSLLWDEYQSSISQWLELIHGHRKFPIKFIIEFEEAKTAQQKELQVSPIYLSYNILCVCIRLVDNIRGEETAKPREDLVKVRERRRDIIKKRQKTL